MKFVEVVDESGDVVMINVHDISMVIPRGSSWELGSTILFRKGATQYTALDLNAYQAKKLREALLSA